MLPTAELTALRTVAEGAMQDTCTIQTRTEVKVKGSVSYTYTDTYTLVKCRLMPAKGSAHESEISDREAAINLFVLTVPYNQALTETDRVVHQGTTYEVVGPPNADHSYRTARRAYLAVVK